MPKIAHLTLALLLAATVPAHASGTPEPADTPAVSRWSLPLDGGKVSSFFGALRGKRAHGGVDFSTPTGTPIKATDSGTVVASTNRYEGDKKYGEVVVIEHPNGLRSLYAHLKERLVRVGDMVSAGELIGHSGTTGRSTGPHLHLEAFKDGKRIDPQNLLEEPLEDNALRQALNAKRAGEADAVYSAPRMEAKAGKHTKHGRHGGGKAATAKAPAKAKAVAAKSTKRTRRG
jgi:murein DD-endopeptidase MepM/ murein hydrolase activator NlpD